MGKLSFVNTETQLHYKSVSLLPKEPITFQNIENVFFITSTLFFEQILDFLKTMRKTFLFNSVSLRCDYFFMSEIYFLDNN